MDQGGSEPLESSHKRRLRRSLERKREIEALTAKKLVVVQSGDDQLSVTTDSRLNAGAGRPLEDLRPIFGGRLIKRVFDALPEGSFMHSNCSIEDSTPLLAVTIGGMASRDELWGRVKLLRLNGTKFYVYRDIEAYRLDMTMQRRPHV